MSEMRVVGIRVEPPQSQPVLLLQETAGERYLPIWIGQSEAASIALRQKGVEPPRPLTHDLIVNLISALGHELLEVRIVDMQEGTFYADLVFAGDLRISARPSDSVAIALRAEVPIFAEESVLAEAGLLMPSDDPEETDEAEPASEVKEDEVEKFKEFLDSVSPDDFKASGGA
ncbi:bifunctional nuclease family protein [Williamsia sp.]|uniref:bifunctional nuclease family protein n=1 Tax=Williamsia sp. TaxID=1872085 RepID=UPI002F93464D